MKPRLFEYYALIAVAIVATGSVVALGTSAKASAAPQSLCVGGVEYLQFTAGATVAYNPDGSIKQCGAALLDSQMSEVVARGLLEKAKIEPMGRELLDKAK